MFIKYLTSKGMSLRPPESFGWHSDMETLVVTAIPSEQNKIEKIFQQLNQSSHQVHFKTYFLEVPESYVSSVLAAGTAINTPDNHPVEIMDDNKMRQLFGLLRSQGAKTLAQPEVVMQFSSQTQTRAASNRRLI